MGGGGGTEEEKEVGAARRADWRPDLATARGRWQLVREFPRASRPLTIATFVCVIVGASMPLGYALASGLAVGAVPEAVTGGFDSPAGRRLLTGIGLVGVVFVVGQVLIPVQDTLIGALSRRLRGRTYRRTMAAVLEPPTIAHLEDPALLDQVAAATTVAPTGPASAVRSLMNQWRRMLSAGSGLVLLAAYRWWLPAVLVLAQARFLRRNRIAFNSLIAFRTTHLPGLRRAVYFRTQALTPGAAKEIRVFGLAEWVVERFREAWLAAMTEVWRRRRGTFLSLASGVAPVVAIYFAGYWMLGRSAVNGETSLGELVAYSQALMVTVRLSIAGDDISIEEGAAVVRATNELVKTVSTDPRLSMSGSRTADGLPRSEIRFESVSFRYPGHDRDVLCALDLRIPVGTSLAVVGDNGAGKTTLVKLLARLYDPNGGRIVVDGIPLTDIDARSWQRRVAAVFQDFVRYPLTAAENVSLGTVVGRDALNEAARRAGATGVVDGLPKGWDTVLSPEFEGGVDISGGEWQRIALARALAGASGQASILVLDEPTAHLDARAEAEFFDNFLDVTAGCTTLVISHRFSTVRRADNIVVLDGGRVIESGSHDELLALGGRYAAMFGLQASRFSDLTTGAVLPADG